MDPIHSVINRLEHNAKRIDTEIKTISSKVSYLLTKTTSTDTGNNGLENRVESLEEEYNDLSAQVFANTTAIEQLTDIPDFSNQIAEMSSDIAELKTRMDGVEAQTASLTTKTSQNATDIASITDEVHSNTDTISTIQGEVTLNTTQVAQNVTDITMLDTKVSDLDGKVTTNEDNITALNTQISDLNTDVEQNGTQVAQNTTDIISLNTTVSEIDAKVLTNESNITNITTQINDISDSVDINTTNIATLDATVSGFDDRITEVEGEMEDISNEVETYDTRITEVETEVTDLSDEVGTFDTRISNVEDTVADLDTEVHTFDGRITDLENLVTQLQTDLTSLAQDVSDLKQGTRMYIARIGYLNQGIAMLYNMDIGLNFPDQHRFAYPIPETNDSYPNLLDHVGTTWFHVPFEGSLLINLEESRDFPYNSGVREHSWGYASYFDSATEEMKTFGSIFKPNYDGDEVTIDNYSVPNPGGWHAYQIEIHTAIDETDVNDPKVTVDIVSNSTPNFLGDGVSFHTSFSINDEFDDVDPNVTKRPREVVVCFTYKYTDNNLTKIRPITRVYFPSTLLHEQTLPNGNLYYVPYTVAGFEHGMDKRPILSPFWIHSFNSNYPLLWGCTATDPFLYQDGAFIHIPTIPPIYAPPVGITYALMNAITDTNAEYSAYVNDIFQDSKSSPLGQTLAKIVESIAILSSNVYTIFTCSVHTKPRIHYCEAEGGIGPLTINLPPYIEKLQGSITHNGTMTTDNLNSFEWEQPYYELKQYPVDEKFNSKGETDSAVDVSGSYSLSDGRDGTYDLSQYLLLNADVSAYNSDIIHFWCGGSYTRDLVFPANPYLVRYVISGTTARGFSVSSDPTADFTITWNKNDGSEPYTSDVTIPTPVPDVNQESGVYLFIFEFQTNLQGDDIINAHFNGNPNMEGDAYWTEQDGGYAHDWFVIRPPIQSHGILQFQPYQSEVKVIDTDGAFSLTPTVTVALKSNFHVNYVVDPLDAVNVFYDASDVSNTIANMKLQGELKAQMIEMKVAENRIAAIAEATSPTALGVTSSVFMCIASLMTPGFTMACSFAIGMSLALANDAVQGHYTKAVFDGLTLIFGTTQIYRKGNGASYSPQNVDPITTLSYKSLANSEFLDDADQIALNKLNKYKRDIRNNEITTIPGGKEFIDQQSAKYNSTSIADDVGFSTYKTVGRQGDHVDMKPTTSSDGNPNSTAIQALDQNSNSQTHISHGGVVAEEGDFTGEDAIGMTWTEVASTSNTPTLINGTKPKLLPETSKAMRDSKPWYKAPFAFLPGHRKSYHIKQEQVVSLQWYDEYTQGLVGLPLVKKERRAFLEMNGLAHQSAELAITVDNVMNVSPNVTNTMFAQKIAEGNSTFYCGSMLQDTTNHMSIENLSSMRKQLTDTNDLLSASLNYQEGGSKYGPNEFLQNIKAPTVFSGIEKVEVTGLSQYWDKFINHPTTDTVKNTVTEVIDRIGLNYDSILEIGENIGHSVALSDEVKRRCGIYNPLAPII